MDRIQKFLRLLDEKHRLIVRGIMIKILEKNLTNLDCKKMQGHKNMYRCKHKDIRVIFQTVKQENVIVDIGFRKDVYKKWQ